MGEWFIFSQGTIGVNLFVIASGFGLAISTKKHKLNFISFLKKRVFKIMPLYWMILVALLGSYLLRGISINYKDFFLHFLGVHSFFPQYVLSISAPFWFIGTILQLYLLFPLLLKISQKVHPFILIIGAFIVKVFLDPIIVSFLNGGRFFSEYIIEFTLGVIFGNLLFNNPSAFKNKKFILLIIPFSLFFSGMISLNLFDTSIPFLHLIDKFAVTFLFILLFSLAELIPQKVLILLSSLSFTLYLTHYLLITELLIKVDLRMNFCLEAILFLFISLLFSFFLNISIKKLKGCIT